MLKNLLALNSKSILKIVLALGLSLPLISFAQLAEPNAEGVAMGHIHYQASDVDATNKFFETLGSTAVQNGPFTMHGIPGVLILVRPEPPTVGTGSSDTIIYHVAFEVPDLEAAAARYEDAGIEFQRVNDNTVLLLNGPDGMGVGVSENSTMTDQIQLDHIHFFTPELDEMREWYAEMFGAVLNVRNTVLSAEIPGVNLSFTEIESSALGTTGTVLDHIGFEVTDIRATIAKLEAAGLTMDLDYREIPEANLAIAFVTDPWGVSIELTQGLEPQD